MMITPSTYWFSAHSVYLVGVQINNFFIHETRSHNCDTGWVLCHISMVFISIPFKPQKGTPTMVTPSTWQFSTDSSKEFILWA